MARPKRRSSVKVEKPQRPCTYELGYVRQDLYACRRCTKANGGNHTGFCAGCRESCHGDHVDEVFELYTKRNFRCDCGNSRAGNQCVLQPEKDSVNVGNLPSYSHNFSSRYCRCDRPYDSTLSMAQCAMCEDWFHELCYRVQLSVTPGYQYHVPEYDYELTCRKCVSKLPVLAEYIDRFHIYADAADVRAFRDARVPSVCVRPKKSDPNTRAGSVDLLWRPGFRLHLCTCAKCMAMYRDANALYIVDRADFVNSVEEDDVLNVFVKGMGDEDVVDFVQVDAEENGAPDTARDDDMVLVANGDAHHARDGQPRADNARDAGNGGAAGSSGNGLNNGESVDHIRERMFTFLHALVTEEGALDRDKVLKYVADLKKDLLANFRQRLDGATVNPANAVNAAAKPGSKNVNSNAFS